VALTSSRSAELFTIKPTGDQTSKRSTEVESFKLHVSHGGSEAGPVRDLPNSVLSVLAFDHNSSDLLGRYPDPVDARRIADLG
jgi:hypothetical protein